MYEKQQKRQRERHRSQHPFKVRRGRTCVLYLRPAIKNRHRIHSVCTSSNYYNIGNRRNRCHNLSYLQMEEVS